MGILHSPHIDRPIYRQEQGRYAKGQQDFGLAGQVSQPGPAFEQQQHTQQEEQGPHHAVRHDFECIDVGDLLEEDRQQAPGGVCQASVKHTGVHGLNLIRLADSAVPQMMMAAHSSIQSEIVS